MWYSQLGTISIHKIYLVLVLFLSVSLFLFLFHFFVFCLFVGLVPINCRGEKWNGINLMTKKHFNSLFHCCLCSFNQCFLFRLSFLFGEIPIFSFFYLFIWKFIFNYFYLMTNYISALLYISLVIASAEIFWRKIEMQKLFYIIRAEQHSEFPFNLNFFFTVFLWLNFCIDLLPISRTSVELISSLALLLSFVNV